MPKRFVIELAHLGAFFLPFGHRCQIVKRDINGNVNCVNCKNCQNCSNCRNCSNCVDCTSCKGCDGCTQCTSCFSCKNCANESNQASHMCQEKKKQRCSTYLSLGHDVTHVPYQVSLERISADGLPVLVGGGVIIRPNWILTSAHCFDSDKSDNLIIGYGALHDKSGLTVMGERLILHPNYRQNVSVSSDDLALIRTATSFQLNNGGLAYPIQLATNEVTEGMVTISSWPGAITRGDIPLSQHEFARPCCTIQARIVPSEASYPKYLLSNMFCVADGIRNSDPAEYSGGSAVQNGQLVGLACGGAGRQGRPGLYTSVAKYADWIDSQIELTEQAMKLCNILEM